MYTATDPGKICSFSPGNFLFIECKITMYIK